MDQGDGVAYGMVFLLCGAGALLVTLDRRYKVAVLAVGVLLCLFMGMPLAGMDVRVPWRAFTEACAAAGGLLFVVALVRTARLIMAGEDGAWR